MAGPLELLKSIAVHKRSPEPEERNIYWPVVVPTLTLSEPTALVKRADSTTSATNPGSTCTADNTSPVCAKPVSSSSMTLPIVLGVVIPVAGAIIALLILHRRHVRKQRDEDANDRHASLDFGLNNTPRVGKKGKGGAEMNGIDMREKSGRGRGMSLDMMNSPYLLPPELHNSRESLRSLSRSLHNSEDPYRQVAAETASIRAPRKTDGSSIYTGSSGAPSRFQETSATDFLSNAGPMPRSPGAYVPPPRGGSLPQQTSPTSNNSLPVFQMPAEPISPIEPAYFPKDPSSNQGVQKNGLPSGPREGAPQGLFPRAAEESRESYMGQDSAALRMSNNYLGAFINSRAESPQPHALSTKEPERSPFEDPRSTTPESDREPQPVIRMSPPIANTLPKSPRPARSGSLPKNEQYSPPQQHREVEHQRNWIEDGEEAGDGFVITPPSPKRSEELRGQRYSMDVPPEEFANAGLGAPGFDAKRLSMGFRPLPPNAAVESDDPEIRANRIRSFYKEYFDDSKPAPQGQYYEDYDENYLGNGDSAYYDPDQNNFVMPYAQPVTRRAMTPPPQAHRFMGQGGQPRAFHGSISQPRGGFQPPRVFHGSVSSASLRGVPQYDRPFSSASNRGRGTPGPRKPMPPPEDLNTIPTPSLLKDDSFALMHSIDFAPPLGYKERQQGRSQSPMGERKPYNTPSVTAHRPLVSAFDELAVMPSPHLLRKSGTFTALDFAPPRRIRTDNDNMSDAGSIRSNRSGISSAGIHAIRSGANRVSRLPQDNVFTKDDIANQLKPTWGLRQPGL